VHEVAAAAPNVTAKPPVEETKPAAKKTEPVKEVRVPKTSVKTSVPYTPDYKPLEQRQNSSKNNEPLVRYSDADLAEFRELISKKMEAAKKELNYLQGLITRTDDMGGDESESRYMTMEDGSMSMEREQLSQMASRQITYIDHLEKALIRIENKTYGICRVTGRLIDKARLRAVPHATLSLEAKLGLVKPNGE
jgi:RNA polymerase-binding transcription factor DksA